MTKNPFTPLPTIPPHPVHPLKSKARVLLTSVFGPFAQDDEYGSRTINPMELYHNQITRVQGPFSLRMFHRSWGIMMIQANINAHCRLLDFPTQKRFIKEITKKQYDIIGISSIIPNIGKVKHMCDLIRTHQPKAKIIIGGHVANIPDLQQRIDADHIVQGEGVRWMRKYLGEDPTRPIQHPEILSGMHARSLGIRVRPKKGSTAATVIPSVGCPMGCNFCSTSAMFGGKGKFQHFFQSGEELFQVMSGLEKTMGVQSFFVMDENFLLHKQRTLKLLELMEKNNKSWVLYVFSSANVLRMYTIEQLVGLGVSWVWMGLEGENAGYDKLKGTDTTDLVRKLRDHGICVVGSTIIGLENHSSDNIDDIIDYAVSHDTEFHQFMLYTPLPGTPLHAEHQKQGTLKTQKDCAHADTHGQLKFAHLHPLIKEEQETEFLLRAFQRDFDINGPSVIRVIRTTLLGWKRYKNHPDPRIRKRFAWEGRDLASIFSGAVWAAKKWGRRQPLWSERLTSLLQELYDEFGIKARLAAPIIGRYIGYKLRREDKRLRKGITYEPPTYYEKVQRAVGV